MQAEKRAGRQTDRHTCIGIYTVDNTYTKTNETDTQKNVDTRTNKNADMPTKNVTLYFNKIVLTW